jgi:multidrug resistance efflux pump
MADLAQSQWTRLKELVARNAVEPKLADEAENKAQAAQAELEAKKAEVLEAEIRIKQAQRRLEATEARLKREAERVKARLDWSEGQFKKGFVSKSTYVADKASYDELMIQLDPKFVPAPAAETPKAGVP